MSKVGLVNNYYHRSDGAVIRECMGSARGRGEPLVINTRQPVVLYEEGTRLSGTLKGDNRGMAIGNLEPGCRDSLSLASTRPNILTNLWLLS